MAMTHKERVYRAIRREPLDYFPSQIDFTAGDVARVAAHFGVREEELDQAVDNHLAYAFPLSNACMYTHNRPVMEHAIKKGFARLDEPAQVLYDAWGVGWDMTSEGVWVKVHPLPEVEDFKHYRFPDANAEGLMDYTEQVVQSHGDEHFIMAFQHISIFERAWALHGWENLMVDMQLHPEAVDELFERIGDYLVGQAKRFVGTGVDAVRVGDDYGSQRGVVMGAARWRRFIKPRLQRIWNVYREAGLPIFLHSCGDIREILGDLVEMGLQVLHPVQPLAMPIEYLADKYGPHVTFFGGIDTQEVLPFGTPADVDAATRKCVEVLGRHGSYIVSPSQEIMTDVPGENLDALVSAIKYYRTQLPC